MPTTPPPRTAPSGVHRPAAELLAEENERLRLELRRQRVAVVPTEPMSARMGRIANSRSGFIGTFAAALALVMGSVSQVTIAYMDTNRLRDEQAAARKLIEEQAAALRAYDERIRTLDARANALDAWRNQELEREPKREEAICRAGQQVPWRVDLTCRRAR